MYLEHDIILDTYYRMDMNISVISNLDLYYTNPDYIFL